MKVSAKGYKLLKKIKDDKFDVDRLHLYNLYVLLGTRDIQLAVVDNSDNRCLLVEDYVLTNTKSYSELITTLELLFDDHHLLKAGFWQSVKVGLKNNKFSLVPSSLFSKTALYDYLKLNCPVDPDTDQFLYYRHIKSDAVNTFAINQQLYQWLSGLYPKKEIGLIHQSSSLIEGVLAQLDKHPKDSIFVYVDRFKLHVIASRDNKLEYYNQFQIKEFKDYIKYIMLVMKGLGKDQKTTNVTLWGYIGRESAHYTEFGKYIKHLSFGERPRYMKFSYMFDELQDHHYFDLYNLHLCE